MRPAAVGEVEGRIALPALELQDAERAAKALDVGLHVVGELGLVEDVGLARTGVRLSGRVGHGTVLEPWHRKFEARLRHGPQGGQ